MYIHTISHIGTYVRQHLFSTQRAAGKRGRGRQVECHEWSAVQKRLAAVQKRLAAVQKRLAGRQRMACSTEEVSTKS